jgi:ribonuclease HI
MLAIIYTDGACSGNPGPGGWGAVLQYHNTVRELHGGEHATTNNRMELLAAICALQELPGPMEVRLYSDSKYVVDGMTTWLPGWQRHGWRTSSRQPVKNVDLWQRLVAAAAPHRVDWQWVKGHNDNPGNDRADELARQGLAENLVHDLAPRMAQLSLVAPGSVSALAAPLLAPIVPIPLGSAVTNSPAPSPVLDSPTRTRAHVLMVVETVTQYITSTMRQAGMPPGDPAAAEFIQGVMQGLTRTIIERILA